MQKPPVPGGTGGLTPLPWDVLVRRSRAGRRAAPGATAQL